MITNKDISIDSENGKITLNGNKYDLGTQGEIDKAVKDIYSVMGQLGAKNLIPYPYYQTTQTVNGITVTDNGDGSITLNGTASAAGVVFRYLSNDSNIEIPLERKKYKLTFGSNAGSSGFHLGDISLIKTDSTTQTINMLGDAEIDNSNGDYVGIFAMGVYIVKNKVIDNVTLYPMLRLASDTDNTYEPYAMTNKQLTEQVTEVKGTIGDITQTGITGADVAAQLETLSTALSYGAGDVITAENVVAAAVGANTSDCYFSVPISKPVTATTVTISDVSCNLYYGTNQMEAVTEGAYTATIEGGSLLIKLTKANTFSQYGRYIVDFTGTFTFA